jgi:hypothetical protein
MSYPNVWLHVLNNARDIITRPREPSSGEKFSAIATGAHDVLFTRKYLRKYGIHTISDEEFGEHMCADTAAYHRSSNRLAAQVLKQYGYDSYADIDIYDRADIVLDLSEPVPEKYQKKYDLVLDIISTYVTNIIQSYSNTSKMTKVGGIKIVVTTVGDHTNRFELNPSPNFLLDFHLSNGFTLARGFLINPKGTILPYRRYATKGTPAFVLLPFFDWIATLIRTLNAVRIMRPPIRSGEWIDYPARPGDKEYSPPVIDENSRDVSAAAETQPVNRKPGLRGKVKDILRTVLGDKKFNGMIRANRKLRYARTAFLHDNLCHEWYAYFVFRKVAEVDDPSIHITSHYEKLDQTKDLSE